MLDVSGLGPLWPEVVKTRIEYDLRIENGGIHYGSLRDGTLRRKARRTVIPAITRFRTIEIAADASNGRSRPGAERLLAAIRKLRHRARTFLLMRANTRDRSQHEER